MRLLRHQDKGFSDGLAAFCRGAGPSPKISASVAAILARVRTGGDRAVSEFTARFDGVRLSPRRFRVGQSEIARAVRGLSPASRHAMLQAMAAVASFNRRGVPEGWRGRNPQGARVGEKFDPIRRVGIYVPGGEVPLVSTALMTVTLARIAGCPEIAAFTPPGPGGRVAPELLAALSIAGAREIYRIGGVQAVGAMAYGTRTIPAVDKVFGPGNAYVCEAKRQVFGTVGVDSLPGPSELMVIADASARPDFAAADLLAQAEHGSGSERIYLVSASRRVIDRVLAEIKSQLGQLSRSAKIDRVLERGFLAVEVGSLKEAAEVATYVAPEHLELLVGPAAAARLERSVTTAGAIMTGNLTPTALGDFTAGPSHVLPTGRSGRFLSGLRTADFLRRTSLVTYDRRSIRLGERVVAAFARMERLDAHGRSVRIRL